MTQLERKRSYLTIITVLLIVFILFAWATYKLIASQLYYHVTVEQYVNDNQTITEAFREETAMRRHFQHRLASKKVEVEKQQELLASKSQELEGLRNKVSELQRSNESLLKDLYKAKHEKDSLSSIISSLRRVH